ncbi:MAG: hypothetical protein WAO09_09015 [Candidatus Dormiibacterota bacterium]|jgi:hypothetical protein
MKPPLRRSSSRSVVAALRSEFGRLREAIGELGRGGARLQPALVPAPIRGGSLPPQELAFPSGPLQMAFGRRKDGKSPDEDEAHGEATADNPDQLSSENEPDLAQLPPIPSAIGATEIDEEAERESDQASPTPEAASSWAPLESATAETGMGPETEAEAAALPEADLPAWGSRSIEASAFETPAAAATGETRADSEEPTPWGSAPLDDEDQTTFAPSVVDPRGIGVDNLSWLPEGADEPAPWAVTAETEDKTEAAAGDTFAAGPIEVFEEVDEVQEITAEPPAGEVVSSLESLTEMETVSVERWTTPEPVPVATEAAVFPKAPEVFAAPTSEAPSLQTRSFPLPEGELVFRNLRAGFTDPARLLRHLAGEGHTGVLHVLGVDGSNGYVVLVDGYVVAVANDRQGSISTTTRVTFPNFPNSQDAINVISYSRQIARGLGLLLHAPVRFAGLGAMFVNLEGLRSYLSKYSSSGGLIVHAQEGIGVALFDDGKLVGAYANGNPPTSDLAQLKDLVKDLEAEIDVRFGGPKELEPIPLDTLLSGYPL